MGLKYVNDLIRKAVIVKMYDVCVLICVPEAQKQC